MSTSAKSESYGFRKAVTEMGTTVESNRQPAADKTETLCPVVARRVSRS
jgi:hypothetical protein